MHYVKMMIKSIFVFGAVLGITFSANAMKRHHDDYQIDFEQLKKKYEFADDYKLEKENITQDQQRRLKNAHIRNIEKLDLEERVQRLEMYKVRVKKANNKILADKNTDVMQKKFIPMPSTPMPIKSGKGIQGYSFAGCPVKLPICLNALHKTGDIVTMQKILKDPDNTEMLKQFKGYDNSAHLAGNSYLSAERMRNKNNNNF